MKLNSNSMLDIHFKLEEEEGASVDYLTSSICIEWAGWWCCSKSNTPLLLILPTSVFLNCSFTWPISSSTVNLLLHKAVPPPLLPLLCYGTSFQSIHFAVSFNYRNANLSLFYEILLLKITANIHSIQVVQY